MEGFKMKKGFIKKSCVVDIKFTPDPDNDDHYRVGPIGKCENVTSSKIRLLVVDHFQVNNQDIPNNGLDSNHNTLILL